MLIKFIAAVLFVLTASSSAFSAFHNAFVAPNQKDLNYFMFPQATGGSAASSLSFDFSPEKDRIAELYMFGHSTLVGYSASATNIVGLLGKQNLLSFGNLSFSGVAGLSGLFSQTAGFSLAPSAGGILGYAVNPGLKISIPVVLSIFNDGVMADYSAGAAFAVPGLKDKELILGAKGIFMGVLTSNAGALQNTLFGMAGFRSYF